MKRVWDMIDAGRLALRYTEHVNRDQFLDDLLVQDAVIRRLSIMGEAAKQISVTFRESHPAVPWREIAGFRDVAVHGYDQLDMERIWRMLQTAVPETVTALTDLLPPEEP